MTDDEWYALIQKICDEKGVFFSVGKGIEERFVSCMELKDEIRKNI